MNNVGVSPYRSNMQGGQPKQSRLMNIILKIVKQLCDLIHLSMPASKVQRPHEGVRAEQVTWWVASKGQRSAFEMGKKPPMKCSMNVNSFYIMRLAGVT